MTTRFISTAIPYVNAAPHIGFVLELILADTLARHARQCTEAVYFLSGTDDNSLKNALAAEAEGIPTAALVRRNAAAFQALKPQLDLSYDDFLGTSTDPRHAPAVAKLWRACERSGDIYRARYSGLYCIGCERFFTETEAAQGGCPEHPQPLERISEENYFFRLSRYQDALIRLIETDAYAIRPTPRKNEALAFLQAPLEDLSISRSTRRAHGWGIPVPGDPEQVVYVWFDALANYISALGYADDAPAFDRFWRRGDRISHVIGKTVLRFHAIYWPAMLLSAGLRPPTELLVHGNITAEGRKIGKSLGNSVAPEAIRGELGTDALRYFLLRHIGSHRDGDFSLPRYREVYEHELANQLGNLLSRTVGLARRYGIPEVRPSSLAEGLREAVTDEIDAFALHKALEEIWRVVEAANAYVSRKQPWKLARDGDRERLGEVVNELYATLGEIAVTLAPLLPATASSIHETLQTGSATALFPRVR